jgi:ATP-dependent Clp protease ATP-binding subunit ClpB
MSEYMEKHAVSRLIGPPPGYIGYEAGGQLTEIVRRNPYSVILFDEIEKAHEDVFNLFLQILDDGRLTDNKGKTVDFKNTIIIMTSNIGSQYLLEDEGEIKESTRELVMSEMKRRFKPEFLNRVDDIIMFKPLNKEGIRRIIDIFLNELRRRLSDRNIDLSITDSAKDILINEGYDPIYGARPLKRYIGNILETKIAKMIIAGQITDGCNLIIDGIDDKIEIRSECK